MLSLLLERRAHPRRSRQHKRRMTGLMCALGVLVVTGACISEPEERDLAISLSVEETPVVLGDSAIFEMSAEGPRLVEFEVEFGDGRVLSDDGQLAVELRRRIAHLYEESGTFQATARIVAIDGSVASDQVSVEILPDP